MDAKSFVIGVACGACAVVAAGWLFGKGDQQTVSVDRGQDSTSIVSLVEKPRTSTVESNRGTPEIALQQADELPAPESKSTKTEAPWPSKLRAVLAEEPKDDSWAYYMEQTLLQYLSSHPSIAQFDISYIECRTTVCQIEVIGFNESTVPVWGQVTHDIQQQPWSEFGQNGTSSGTVEDRLVYVSYFHRVVESN